MKVLAVIPARYASTRFPGKPLALLAGKPIIQWVWENVVGGSGLAACGDGYVAQHQQRNGQCESTLRQDCAAESSQRGPSQQGAGADAFAVCDAVVATDDQRICDAVQQFGGKAMLTGSHHRSGTDRCGEVLRNMEAMGRVYDVVINVQGDEPFVQPSQLASLVACFADANTQIATLKTAIRSSQELFSPNNVKVVCGKDGRAVYFSRQPIPFLRGVEPTLWFDRQPYFKHVGIYAFRAEVLKEVVQLQPSPLELSESLEQLRWLENGYTIRVCATEQANIGIDTPEDLAAAEQYLLNKKK